MPATRHEVPAVLRPIVEVAGPGVPPLLALIEARLRRAAAPGDGPVDEVAERTVAAGGKRLRPLLAILVAGAPVDGAPRDAVVRAGVAVELIHTATLVHDDVLDAAPLRRGRPTAFHTHGRAAATVVGDRLLAAAFAEIARGGDPEPAAVLAEASRALARGELLQRADAWRADVDEARYLERCRLKTGALFAAAARLGALAGDRDPDAYARFAEALGVAFQLFDDVLDVVGPPEVTGKARGTDLLDGTMTLPFLLARAESAELAALDPTTIGPADAEGVCDRIAATGAIAATEDRARELVAAALAALPADDDVRRADALALVARGVVDRRL
ncbi:MAG: polyprenyl synthetase family protein [Solirubrobacteraceae bacterium]|nr:polyprenyl synthetase family protein [Solirubrobacteraceae bacterium]